MPTDSLLLPIILGVLLIVLAAIAIFWSRRAVRPANPPPPPMQATDPKKMREGRFPEPPQRSNPRFQDLIHDSIHKTGLSVQKQTPDYTLRIEEENNRTRFVVNGTTYAQIDDIPNAKLRDQILDLYHKSRQLNYIGQLDTVETLRQVEIGNQTSLEAKSQEYNISVQKEGKETRYIVNGQTFYSLNDIHDVDIRNRLVELMSHFS